MLVLPLNSEVLPKPYFNSADMCLTKEALGVYIGGTANAKVGYSRSVTTGKSAAFFMTGDMLNMVLRDNAVVQDGDYCVMVYLLMSQTIKYCKPGMVLGLVN